MQHSDLLTSVRSKIVEIATRVLGEDFPEFTNDENLIELGLIDSPGVIELVIWTEEEFAITIAEDEVVLDNLGTVTAMVSFIENKTE